MANGTIKSMVWIAVVRSLVQRGLEWGLATVAGTALVNVIGDLGFTVNPDSIVTPVSIFLFGVIVALVNWLGPKFVWINKFVSLGLSRTGPAYVTNDADAVILTANADSTDTVKAVDVPPPGANV